LAALREAMTAAANGDSPAVSQGHEPEGPGVHSSNFRFPDGFLWGAATSSHQVEGNCRDNDWWAWEQAGKVPEPSGDACDHYHRFREDFDLARALGHNAHRFSLEWSRIEPEPGRWDEGALENYRTILQGGLDRGLLPMVTLHHFSNPRWLAERGGWENPEVISLFERYVRKAATALEGLVALWVTINEPNVYATLGYLRGVFPPGVRHLGRAGLVLEHMVAAHAAAYQVLHQLDPGCLVGVAHHYRGFEPRRPGNPLDAWAARLRQAAFNDLVPRALVDGRVRFPGRRRRIPAAVGTQDFLGLNYYTSEWVSFDPRAWSELFGRGSCPAGADLSPTGHMANHPAGLWRALQWARAFGLPIYVTENGVEDPRDNLRPRYLCGHLRQVWRAANANWRVRGYYHWTLVDNFEWDRGWTQRFGLYALDPKRGARTRRPSAELYAKVCRQNALSSDMVAQFAPEALEALFPGGRSMQGLARAP
jgi:beta-glucosidase